MTSGGPCRYLVTGGRWTMLKVEAFIQPFKLDEVKITLEGLGIQGIILSEVLDHGGPIIQTTTYRGVKYRVDAPKIKLEMIVSSLQIDEVVEALSCTARTGMAVDDGTILVYEVAEAIRIRSGDRIKSMLS